MRRHQLTLLSSRTDTPSRTNGSSRQPRFIPFGRSSVWRLLGVNTVLPMLIALFAMPAYAQAPERSASSVSTSPSPDGEPQDGRSDTGEENHEEDRDDRDHEGFLSRISLGIGYGLYAGKGQADPIPGVEVIRDPSHGGPALDISLDWGFSIIDNLALHIGATFETILTSDEESSIGGFYFFGLGGGASYYFMPYDLYLTGRVRWVGVLFYLPDAACDVLGTEKLEGFDGIGFSLSFGKEWFADEDDAGFGVGLQVNYAYLADKPGIHAFSILLAPTLTSF